MKDVNFDWFDRFNRLGGRFHSMKSALHILSQIKEQPMIVETGCLRGDADWGAGMSSYIFGIYTDKYGGYFHSVDINPDNVKMAEFVCQGLPVNIHTSDSVQFLQAWDKGKIDLLYLDSYDYPLDNRHQEAKISQTHQLSEIEFAWDKLADKAVILLDDIDFLSGGKSKVSEAFLRQHNALNIYRGQQSLWLKGF